MQTARRSSIVRRSVVTASNLRLHHRGFALRLEQAQDGSDRYSFSIESRGYTLHTSASDFRTAQSAERAARVFVDDALGGYERATRALDA